jgi:hypothetical protein
LAVCAATLAAIGVPGCLHPMTRFQKEDDSPDNKDPEVKTIGDVTEVANASSIVVSGVGLVTGLEGTGGGTPPGIYRTMLEKELARLKVENVKQILASENNALVLVAALIPAGVHRGDPLEVEVTLPPYSGVKSLRGGVLQECYLSNYESTKQLSPDTNTGNRYLKGHILAKAQGPLMVGFGAGEGSRRPNQNRPAAAPESMNEKQARIWGGGVSLIDRPFYLTLNNDQQFARIANAVAERINQTFHDDSRKRLLLLGKVTDRIGDRFNGPAGANNAAGPTARALNRETVYVRVPWEYRLDPERYLRVARLIPLEDTPRVHNEYRSEMARRLLNPKKTMSAALRLEALGSESIDLLKTGLQSDNVLVRFSSAEALAYLGSPSGGEELARLVQDQPRLRAYALTALTSLNESICHVKLAELMLSPHAETRYGAFRALFTMDERDPEVQGRLLNETFWLHEVAPQSPPLVHISGSRRVEIVLFGAAPSFVPPFSLVSAEYTVTAGPSDDKCTIGYFPMHRGGVQRRQCSLKVDEVLQALTDLGCGYPEATDVLLQAHQSGCLNCSVRLEALTPAPPVEELAKKGTDPAYWKASQDEETTADVSGQATQMHTQGNEVAEDSAHRK